MRQFAVSRSLIRWRRMRWCAAALSLAVISCQKSTDPDDSIDEVALLRPAISSIPVISLPLNPRAGVPFELTLNTVGLNGCWQRDRTHVSVSVSATTVTPYNRSGASANVGCTQAITNIVHRVMLTFATAGEHRVIVRGRDFDTWEPTVIDATIVVNP